MRFNKWFTRYAACLSLSLLFLIAAVARPALTQSDGYASPDNKKAVSELSVSPTTLSYSLNLDKAASETRDFTIKNTGTLASGLYVNVGAPSNPDYVITSGSGASLIPAKGSLTVGVEFTPAPFLIPKAKGTAGTVIITSNATSGKSWAIVHLNEKVTQKEPTPTATATATSTGSATATATPTATPTPAACPRASRKSCPSPGASPSIFSLIPSSAVAGGPGVPLAVCGCNLTASTAVQWNGVAQPTSFVSSNQLNASVPSADIANVGVDQVTVAAASEVSAPQTFFVGSTGGDGYAELVIDQQANDIVYDSVNQVIYLSVPGDAPTNANTISVLSLATGQITSAPFAGSNPDALAISDDSQFLYAGIDGSASVQRFTLPGLAPDISYPLGSNSFFGPYYALDLQVAPGAPHTTAVALGVTGITTPAVGGIVIFDDSTPRSTTAPAGSFDLYSSLQWGSDDTALYAANNESSSFDLYVLSVGSAGVTLQHDYPGDFSKYYFNIHFDSGTGLIYADDGQIVDPSTGKPAGEYSVSGINVMVPDSTLNTVFFVGFSASPTMIQTFNQQKFSPINSITLLGISTNPRRIIRWGNNGLAFNTWDGGQLYLIGGNFVH